MRKIRKVFLFVLLSTVLILQPASLARAENNWAVGNLVGLCAGTEIRVGSGDQYPVHTIVPEDNWTVKVIGGPRIVNGETWWDTSRYAAGDPSGGTGWIRQSQADACQNSGGGGNGGGGGDGGDGDHRDGTLDRPKIADDQQPPLADYFVWPLNVGPDSNDYVKNYYGFRSPLQYQPCTSAVKSGDYYYLPGVEVKPENRLLHPGKDMAIQGKTGGKDEIAYDDLPKVYAVANGKVVAIENNTGGYGTHVIIYHRFMNGDKTEYVWSLYAHLHPDSLRVTEVGQEVKAGDWIGRYDHTGNWGDVAHTHFELRKARSPQYCQTSSTISSYYYDPEAFIQQRLPAPGTLQEQAVKIATASTGKSPVYQQQTVIQPAQKIGPFQFVVTSIQNWMRAVYAFFFPGSTLEISIYRPDGSLYGTYLASSSFVLEIENPEAGSWSYTVQAIEIPQADYPFAVAVSLSDHMLQNTGEELQGDTGTSGSGDTIPPVTTINLSPAAPDGNQNWYKQPVMVTLNATDNTGGNVDTLYSLNNGRTYHLYTTPFTVSTEGINDLAYFSIDPMGNSEAFQTVILKIDLTPPVVEAWTDQTQYNRLQPYVVHFSGYDPMPGSGLAYLNGIFNGQMVADGQIVDLFWLGLGNYNLTVTGEDIAGWTTQQTVSFELIASIESLQGSVTRLCNENYITKSGVCNELSQKLAAALSAKQRGNMNAAVQILQAFQHAVQAQSGKSIKPEANWLLMMDSNYVIQTLEVMK